MEIRVLQSHVGNNVRASHLGAHPDSSAVEFGADQLAEAGGHRLGSNAVSQKSHAIAEDLRPKAVSYLSANQDAVACDKIGIGYGFDVDRKFAILDEKVYIALPVVGDGCFEGDGRRLLGLGMREEVYLRQRSERGRRRWTGYRGAYP